MPRIKWRKFKTVFLFVTNISYHIRNCLVLKKISPSDRLNISWYWTVTSFSKTIQSSVNSLTRTEEESQRFLWHSRSDNDDYKSYKRGNRPRGWWHSREVKRGIDGKYFDTRGKWHVAFGTGELPPGESSYNLAWDLFGSREIVDTRLHGQIGASVV